jgi:hypothetical protein
MSKDTGGPAFPTQIAHQASNSTWHYEGMTLRDYFAAKAMQTKTFSVRPYDTTKEIANDAYRMADAMLEARGEK